MGQLRLPYRRINSQYRWEVSLASRKASTSDTRNCATQMHGATSLGVRTRAKRGRSRPTHRLLDHRLEKARCAAGHTAPNQTTAGEKGATSSIAPRATTGHRAKSGRVLLKLCQPQTISLRQAICLPHHRPSPDVLAHVTQGICTGDRSAQPHPAARGRITLGPTRANKSYNRTHQPGASPTG